MTAPSRTPDRASLVDDLVYLRKGEGLTPGRLTQADAVFKILGGDKSSPELAMERLVSCLRGMLDAKGGQALWAAFGLNEAGEPDECVSSVLKTRRSTHAERVGRKSYTVREWEDVAIDELALRLLSGWFPSAATPFDSVLPHGGLLVRSLYVVTTIRDRQFVESRQERTVISLVEHATHFVYGTYSATELFDVQGAEAITERHPGGTIHRITFDPPIARGKQHTFSFVERLPAPTDEQRDAMPASWTTTAPVQDFAGQTFESPTLLYRNEVRFVGDAPAVVWQYDKLSRIERPGQPTERNVLQLADDGRVTTQFFELYGGLASGVAWRW